MAYPLTGGDLTPSPSFPALEEKILAFWKQDGTFEASVANRPAADASDEFVFNDGPPFANGLPHYGHLLTGYVKDVVPRFKTMTGCRVERRFGWDTHGLPAELEAMRQLGITEKSEIEAMGIDVFNKESQESVLRYTREWEKYVTRQARWVDFENDYKTLDLPFMESVMWAFKALYEKDLAYEGYSVLPYCWRDETPLSNHELRMDDDVYQDRQDTSVTVTFPLAGEKAERLGLAGVRALAWTTTPWTLPTNFSLAVGPDIEYVVVPGGPAGAVDEDAAGPGSYLLAADLVSAYASELGYTDSEDVTAAEAALAAVTARHRGAALEHIGYRRLWDYYADTETWGTENAWIITVADYVTTDDGTGVVHQATAYGEEDQKVNAAYGIPVILSVDEGARFLPLFAQGPLAPIAGKQVFDANTPIVRVLREQGRLVRQASYVHSYPHCWRCRNPLIYKAVSSWFVRVTAIKDRMLAHNEQVNWIPGNVKHGQFGAWLEGARDWSISRNRYWGSPIPVWKSDDPEHPRIDVYGSLADLERDFGDLPTGPDGQVNLHRPYIDALTRPNPDDPSGRSTMRRVTDVFDVWFDSGSMPFAQVHYPFENVDWFETRQPADFIVEYIGQTRGWFYVMHVLATALFDRPAFCNVISHGIVLGDDGQKMSKSLRNYPDVQEVFDRDGADAMRWFLMSSPILRGGNLIVTDKGIRDTVRTVLLPLWNAYYFFALYANAAGGGTGYEAQRVAPGAPVRDVLNRYLLAKTHDLSRDVRERMDAYDVSGACAAVDGFLDMLTNWYIRRSRDRFWGDDTEAFDTLYTALEALCRIAAPLLPLTLEEIWKGLTGERSVHLTDFPAPTEFPADPELVAAMDRVRQVAGAGNALRKSRSLRARLPLASLTVVAQDAPALAPFTDVFADELNVKRVETLAADDPATAGLGVTEKLTVNARAAGPRLGKQVQQVIKGSKTGDWSLLEDGSVVCAGIELEDGEYTVEMVADHAVGDAGTRAVAVLPAGGFVVLDTEVTDELAAEGVARDIVRAVQQARRDAGYDISDRIALRLAGDDEAMAAAATHRDLIGREVLAREVVVEDATDAAAGAPDDSAGDAASSDHVAETTVGDGARVRIGLRRL